MGRIDVLVGLVTLALTAGCATASTDTHCEGSGACGTAGGTGGAGASGGGGGTAGSGGGCEAVPGVVPLAGLSEDPPVTAPTWSGALTWVEPAPAPSSGYEVEVYSSTCVTDIVPGFPAAAPSSSYAWTPPGAGKYKWRVRAKNGPGCSDGAWSDFRVLVVPGADIPACSPTAPDPAFGTSGGKAAFYLPDCTYDTVATAIHLDPTSTTGEFYTAGRYYNGSVRRGYVMKHDATGALVSSWGNGGAVALGTPTTANYVHNLVVDCKGEIHIGSRTEWNMRLLRLTKDGAVDAVFGGGAGEVTDDEVIAASITDSGLMDMDQTGSYYQSGTVWTGPGGNAVLTRFRPSGDLDPTFGASGRVAVDFDPTSQDAGGPVKVAPDGKVLMAGYTAAAYPSVVTTTSSDLAVVRVTTTGVLDDTFGDGGITRIDISGTAEMPTNLAVQPDGKILVIGVTNHTTSYTTPAQWLIARLTQDGALDATFGSGGIVILDPPFGGANDVNDRPYHIVVRPDGTLWVAGQWGWNSAAGRAVVARLTAAGALDTCFGTGGWYSVSSWPQGVSQSDAFNGMTQQPDGSLLLVAEINPSAFGYAGLMRLED
jgi:uncharacterized delta-60 repeat protein